MKIKGGVSQVISAVIIASISVAMIIAFLGYAIVTLETASQQAEFERAKGIMKSLAEEVVNTVLTGVGTEISFPTRTLRWNFVTSNSELELCIALNGYSLISETMVDSEILEIKCLAGEFAKGENEVIYGSRENLPFVDDIYLLPLIQTFWDVEEGRVAANLNFTRLLYQEFNFSSTLIIEFSYINVIWEMEPDASGNHLEIRYIGSESYILYSDYVNYVNLTFQLMINGNLLGDVRNREAVSNCLLIIRLVIHNVLFRVR